MFLRLALVASAYLLGSIPFSFLVVRLWKRDDIRLRGSGNVGATNVLRSFGAAPGAISLCLDLLKGLFAIFLAEWLTSRPDWPVTAAGTTPVDAPSFWIGLAALLAVLGHMFPVWLALRGGKGVATAAGAFLAIDLRTAVAALIVFAIVALLTRYVSLASMISAASVPLFLRFMAGSPFWIVVFGICISLAVILRHRANIDRLAQGTERKLGERKEKP